MNMLLKGVDVDLTLPGNPAACGVGHWGAQGSTVTDVAVRASNETFACFCGMNGAGGMHANVAGHGARYGIFIQGAQPVPSGVGLALSGQGISAVHFVSQETLSLVGANISVPAWATGPAIAQSGGSGKGMSLVDVAIECEGGAAAGQVAVDVASSSLYARDLYVRGCAQAVGQAGAAPLPAPPSLLSSPLLSSSGGGGGGGGGWLHVSEYAKGGPPPNPLYNTDVLYEQGVRVAGGQLAASATVGAPPADLVTRHIVDEAAFPDMGGAGVADAIADCGAAGDGETDDTAALQACLTQHGSVFLPPGFFRISATLALRPGGSLVGLNNAASILLAARGGFPAASAAAPQPMLRTAADDGAGARPTTIAFLGVVTWQHLEHVTTLDWQSQHPLSTWRVNFESRNCECIWLAAYQAVAPPLLPAPCSLPVNITAPKSVFRGVGRVYGFVNDDTGAILSTGAKFRSLLIADNGAAASAAARLRFYSLNLEHAQTEANGEVRNASFVDVYSIKGEGNTPLLWLRADVQNVSVLGFGGDPCAFAYNFTQPPDFAQRSPSLFRVDSGARGVKLAAMLDHGFGTTTFWPPTPNGCHWEHHYPYPGEAVAAYPYGTWPNATMWHCWVGDRVSNAYWWMLSDGLGAKGLHTAPGDKPIYWSSPL